MAGNYQRFFCEGVRKLYPDMFRNVKVLDLGSLDINGNNRYLFDGGTYLGVDLGEGANVDVVCKAHDLKFADGSFDVVISTEMLEHDPNMKESLGNAFRMLKSGGLMVLTMGGVGRREHGTVKSIPEDSPFTVNIEGWSDYYRNVDVEDILQVLDRNLFLVYSVTVNNEHCDLYFHGIKK